MSFVEQYIASHLANGRYTQRLAQAACACYLHREGWIDTVIDGSMIFAHRCTCFTKESFTNLFHAHDYYEMVIFVRGEVEYLQENTRVHPMRAMVSWRHPGQMHTTHLLAGGEYERYVFYFSPEFFALHGTPMQMLAYMQGYPDGVLQLSEADAEEMLALLERARGLVGSPLPYAELLLKAYIVELFGMLNAIGPGAKHQRGADSPLAPVKQYIDECYATVEGIREIAERFYYSREHLSRRFKQEFNISLSEYIAKRRVLSSLPLLEMGGVTAAAYAVGFHSQSAYIAAFKRTMGCLPSAYRLREMRE